MNQTGKIYLSSSLPWGALLFEGGTYVRPKKGGRKYSERKRRCKNVGKEVKLGEKGLRKRVWIEGKIWKKTEIKNRKQGK